MLCFVASVLCINCQPGIDVGILISNSGWFNAQSDYEQGAIWYCELINSISIVKSYRYKITLLRKYTGWAY